MEGSRDHRRQTLDSRQAFHVFTHTWNLHLMDMINVPIYGEHEKRCRNVYWEKRYYWWRMILVNGERKTIFSCSVSVCVCCVWVCISVCCEHVYVWVCVHAYMLCVSVHVCVYGCVLWACARVCVCVHTCACGAHRTEGTSAVLLNRFSITPWGRSSH